MDPTGVLGALEQLVYEEVPRPAAGPGEMLVRVHATGNNPVDRYARQGFTVLPEQLRPDPDARARRRRDLPDVLRSHASASQNFSNSANPDRLAPDHRSDHRRDSYNATETASALNSGG